MEEEHYRIHLEIVKKQEFQSYSLKEGLIFQDIKNFLLGKEGKYNRIQANILASFSNKTKYFGNHRKRKRSANRS
ncbi:hypothetical protein C095_08635 [Fusobacterium necrophorum subsp. funduliforme B35]|uniref:Uncharacterized protein n=1 Tax=Fusobacterium necrophorum subsp. funduliforme B35 TaxID=1226633 RepID=A0A0B4E5R3_9FUSO|nr:hypothetical protein C095_08635 [Fusobacterium necrophorum subsp. funduliforme B35]